jgi:hypothetical protein
MFLEQKIAVRANPHRSRMPQGSHRTPYDRFRDTLFSRARLQLLQPLEIRRVVRISAQSGLVLRRSFRRLALLREELA